MPDLHPIVKRLDELICETIPGLQYAVKWKKAYYGLPEPGWIIEMVAYDVSVNVVFFGGAEFDPPPPLGTTERTRYVKVKTLEEAQGTEMHKWIEQAGRVPGWKWESKRPTPTDGELAQTALAAAGIPSVVDSDDAGGAYPFDLSGGARPLVGRGRRGKCGGDPHAPEVMTRCFHGPDESSRLGK